MPIYLSGHVVYNLQYASGVGTAQTPVGCIQYVHTHVGKARGLSHLRVFGCLAYRHITEPRKKFTPYLIGEDDFRWI